MARYQLPNANVVLVDTWGLDPKVTYQAGELAAIVRGRLPAGWEMNDKHWLVPWLLALSVPVSSCIVHSVLIFIQATMIEGDDTNNVRESLRHNIQQLRSMGTCHTG